MCKALVSHLNFASPSFPCVTCVQFTSVANVTYPDTYQRFVDGVDILNFDLGWTMSTGCLITFDFHDRLLVSTIGPIVVVMVLGITYTIAVSRYRRSEEVLQNVRHKHMSTVLVLTFLVYSSASSLVFQMFDCEHLEDGNYYLREDYRIQCDSSKHRALQVFAGVMMVLYPVGIPVLYTFLLFRDRGVLASNGRRMNNPSVRSTSNLWKPYKPSRYFYEVVECGRRILLTGVVLMVDDGIAAKIAVTFMVALFFVFVSEALAPYESRIDTWISRAGHAVTSTSIYFALLLEVNVSDESQPSQSAFEVVLMIMHVFMISSVLVEGGLAAYSLRVKERNVPRRRFWGTSRGIAPVEEFKLELSMQSNERARGTSMMER